MQQPAEVRGEVDPMRVTRPRRESTWWRRTFDFEAQCWIAWSGLLAFGLSGLLQWRAVGIYPALEGGAVVLALCWAIDLVRTGRALRRVSGRA